MPPDSTAVSIGSVSLQSRAGTPCPIPGAAPLSTGLSSTWLSRLCIPLRDFRPSPPLCSSLLPDFALRYLPASTLFKNHLPTAAARCRSPPPAAYCPCSLALPTGGRFIPWVMLDADERPIDSTAVRSTPRHGSPQLRAPNRRAKLYKAALRSFFLVHLSFVTGPWSLAAHIRFA